MKPKPADITQAPSDQRPQYQLGATTDEAKMHAQIADSPIGDPGEIVKRLGQQFTLPRAEPDANISRDMHGID